MHVVVGDVVGASAPVNWWDVVAGLSPLAVLIAAALAAWLAMRTLNQRSAADDRVEWWRRTQWALDHAVVGVGYEKLLGLESLKVLSTSKLARDEDRMLLDTAWESILPIDGPPEDAGGTEHSAETDEDR